MKTNMSHYSHAISRHCDHTQSKIHTVAELLLLSGQFRPIKTENTSTVEISIASAREQINSSLSIILEIAHDITRSMGEMKTRWKVICDMLFRLADAVTVLVELCYYVTFDSLAIRKAQTKNDNGNSTTPAALVDKYATSYAGLEIKLSCIQLKRARLDELSATFIMDICSNISKYISVLTDNCRTVSENGPDTATRDQFKLGIKSVTCAAGSLIASIKSYKGDRSPRHHGRVVVFCEPVLAASHALVSLATEDGFVDPGREIAVEDKEIQKSVFGPCMNIVSGCVQICKSLRDFTYDTGNSHYIQKTKSCQASIVKSSNHLKHVLQKHFAMEFNVRGLSPLKGDNLVFKEGDSRGLSPIKGENSLGFKEGDSVETSSSTHDASPRDLSPFGRCSPLPPSAAVHHGNAEENSGKAAEHHGKNDLSPRSTLPSSDVSFSTGISR